MEQSWNSEGTETEQHQNNNNNVNKDKNDKKDNKKNSRKQVFDETHFQLASFFLEQIRKNNPDHKQPNLETWSNDIRLMMEQDNRNEDQIRYLMKWVQEDDFEKANVLSPSKLRKRFDQLIIKVKNERNKPKKQSIFSQGEESKKRQASIKPPTPEQEEYLRKIEEEMPY